MRKPKTAKPDLINIVATYGAIVFVGATLAYRVTKDFWGSVAFMAITAIIVLAVSTRFIPLDDLDDGESER